MYSKGFRKMDDIWDGHTKDFVCWEVVMQRVSLLPEEEEAWLTIIGRAMHASHKNLEKNVEFTSPFMWMGL